jgi:hypothetical protein
MHKIGIFRDEPSARELLLEYVAVDAPFLQGKVVASDYELCLK